MKYLLSPISCLLSPICRHRRPDPLSIICPGSRHGGANQGFSLVEILVAMTILIIIVMLGSMVFQQTTGAFQTGQRKVDSQVVLRSVIGSITYDLSKAVDSRDYPDLPANSFSDTKISFVALTGTPGVDVNGNPNSAIRTAQIITYSSDGGFVSRTAQSTTCAAGTWATGPSGPTTKLNDDKQTLSDFKFMPDGGDATLPDRIMVRAAIETTGKITSVGAGSGGRKGWDYKDDNIYVGYTPREIDDR